MLNIDDEYFEWAVSGDCDGYFTACYQKDGRFRHQTGGLSSMAEALAALWIKL